MFKIFLCLSIAVAYTQAKFELVTPSADQVSKLLATGKTCSAESGAEPDILEKFIQGSYTNDLTTKKFVYCFLEKGNYSDSDGYFFIDNVLPVVGPHKKAKKFGEVVEQCNADVREVNPQDKYDKAFALVNCLHKNTPLKLKLN